MFFQAISLAIIFRPKQRAALAVMHMRSSSSLRDAWVGAVSGHHAQSASLGSIRRNQLQMVSYRCLPEEEEEEEEEEATAT